MKGCGLQYFLFAHGPKILFIVVEIAEVGSVAVTVGVAVAVAVAVAFGVAVAVAVGVAVALALYVALALALGFSGFMNYYPHTPSVLMVSRKFWLFYNIFQIFYTTNTIYVNIDVE